MQSTIRAHIRSNLVGYLALFIALSGTAYAVDKVGGKDIKNGAVRSEHVRNHSLLAKDIRKGAVKTKQVKNGSLLAEDFAPGQLPTGGAGSGGAPGSDASSPAGAVSFFNLAACPTGWTELTEARGRYIVGLPAGGVLAGTAGTALTNLENRAVGLHNHTITDPGHRHSHNSHAIEGATAGGSGVASDFEFAEPVGASTTGITINDAGNVAGTNAPYIQLRVCQKS